MTSSSCEPSGATKLFQIALPRNETEKSYKDKAIGDLCARRGRDVRELFPKSGGAEWSPAGNAPATNRNCCSTESYATEKRRRHHAEFRRRCTRRNQPHQYFLHCFRQTETFCEHAGEGRRAPARRRCAPADFYFST